MTVRILIAFALLLSPSISHSQLFGPRTYEDCVLEGVKSARTDRAISAVYEMCRGKFPRNRNQSSVKLPSVYLGTNRVVLCSFGRGVYQDVSFRLAYEKKTRKVMLRLDSQDDNSVIDTVSQTESRLIFKLLNNASQKITVEIDFVDGTFQFKDDKSIYVGMCEESI
jgi:hypothetical protein